MRDFGGSATGSRWRCKRSRTSWTRLPAPVPRFLAGAGDRRRPCCSAPSLKRYLLLRALELAGGAASSVKFAEALRDWEPSSQRRIVIKVPGGWA